MVSTPPTSPSPLPLLPRRASMLLKTSKSEAGRATRRLSGEIPQRTANFAGNGLKWLHRCIPACGSGVVLGGTGNGTRGDEERSPQGGQCRCFLPARSEARSGPGSSHQRGFSSTGGRSFAASPGRRAVHPSPHTTAMV